MIEKSRARIGDLEVTLVSSSDCQRPKAIVVLCHGFGAPGTDLVGIGDEFLEGGGSLGDVLYVFPMAPMVLDAAYDGRAWWMIDIEKIQLLMLSGEFRELEKESPQLLPKRRQELELVIQELCRRFDLPTSRVVVGGFSQGAMLATDVAFHAASPLGGLIVWSGALINRAVWSPMARDAVVPRIVQSHGRQDPVLPYAAAVGLRNLLDQAGKKVHFVEFQGQHAIPLEAIQAAAQLINDVASRPLAE